MVGDRDTPSEITSHTLRAIRLREIMSALFWDFNPDAPPPDIPVMESRAMRATQGGPGRTAVTGEMLRAFATTYRAELVRQPQRAMTAAAQAHGISRATANRWTQECRRRGYLAT